MFDLLQARFRQGHHTSAYPRAEPVLPERFRGLPVIDEARCPPGCSECVTACPTESLSRAEAGLELDLGRCLFCTECLDACPAGAVAHTREYRLASPSRQGLKRAGASLHEGQPLRDAELLNQTIQKMFGRSLKLRQVSAGGCNGCESDVNVLSTIVFDLGRFGIQFVASPRHADGMLVTGPVTQNMRAAVLKTYAAIPAPKLVIAVGACALSGGPFAGHEEVSPGLDSLLPVDSYVPGCPPSPWTILHGMLGLLGRLQG